MWFTHRKLENVGRKKKINLYSQSDINHQRLENIGTTMSELVSSQEVLRKSVEAFHSLNVDVFDASFGARMKISMAFSSGVCPRI